MRNAIDKISFFSGLEETHLEALARISSSSHFEKNEIICSEGQEAGGLYAVADGLVRIFKASLNGKEQILHVFGPGEVFAEVALFKGAALPATAQALEPSEIVFIPKREFVELIREAPDLALSMLALLSLRLRSFVSKIEELSLKEVPARFAQHVLLLQAAQGGRDILLDLPKGQLAALLGTIPETLSRILKKFSESNLLDIQGQSIRILNQAALEAVALGKKL